MDDLRYERIIDILFDLKEDIRELSEETTKNTVTLAEHQRRSLASEDRLELLEQQMTVREKQKNMTDGFFKISLGILGVVGTIVGIAVAIQSLR